MDNRAEWSSVLSMSTELGASHTTSGHIKNETRQQHGLQAFVPLLFTISQMKVLHMRGFLPYTKRGSDSCVSHLPGGAAHAFGTLCPRFAFSTNNVNDVLHRECVRRE